MHWFLSFLAAMSRTVVARLPKRGACLALVLLFSQPLVAWAGAAGVSYQMFLDSDSQQAGGCAAGAGAQGAGAQGFEFRLAVDLDGQGEPLPPRWSVCQGGAFVEVAPSSPIEVLASTTLSSPAGLEDWLDLAVPWALLGNATEVRVLVLAGADVLDSGAGDGAGAVWLVRSDSNGVPAPAAGGVQAVPALQPAS